MGVAEKWQHSLAALGALAAVIASWQQGWKAKTKSNYHGALKEGAEGKLWKILDSDEQHFKAVGTWWFVVFVGALAALAAELVDWIW